MNNATFCLSIQALFRREDYITTRAQRENSNSGPTPARRLEPPPCIFRHLGVDWIRHSSFQASLDRRWAHLRGEA
jgi:hypothetical protein